MRSSRLALFSTALLALSVVPATALTTAEVACQTAIGSESQRFAAARQTAIVQCNNAIASGGSCNTGQRDTQIARALARLERVLARRCDGVSLEALGYP